MIYKYDYNDYKTECQKLGISKECFYQRVNKYNWTIEKAISTPVRGRTNKNIVTPNNKPNKCRKKTKISEPSFISYEPTTKKPSFEYTQYLKNRHNEICFKMHNNSLSVIEYSLLKKELDCIDSDINRISSSIWYSMIDMYIEQPDKAIQIYNEKQILDAKIFLHHIRSETSERIDPLEKTIYVDFTNIIHAYS